MNRKLISAAVTIAIALTFCLKAKAEDQPTLIKMHGTAYCLQGVTASGKDVRIGLCASGHRDWLGKTCIIYQRLPDDSVGDILYILEIEDTGCKESVIDIWMPDLDTCQKVMNRLYEDGCKGRIYCQILEDCNG